MKVICLITFDNQFLSLRRLNVQSSYNLFPEQIRTLDLMLTMCIFFYYVYRSHIIGSALFPSDSFVENVRRPHFLLGKYEGLTDCVWIIWRACKKTYFPTCYSLFQHLGYNFNTVNGKGINFSSNERRWYGENSEQYHHYRSNTRNHNLINISIIIYLEPKTKLVHNKIYTNKTLVLVYNKNITSTVPPIFVTLNPTNDPYFLSRKHITFTWASRNKKCMWHYFFSTHP